MHFFTSLHIRGRERGRLEQGKQLRLFIEWTKRRRTSTTTVDIGDRKTVEKTLEREIVLSEPTKEELWRRKREGGGSQTRHRPCLSETDSFMIIGTKVGKQKLITRRKAQENASLKGIRERQGCRRKETCSEKVTFRVERLVPVWRRNIFPVSRPPTEEPWL